MAYQGAGLGLGLVLAGLVLYLTSRRGRPLAHAEAAQGIAGAALLALGAALLLPRATAPQPFPVEGFAGVAILGIVLAAEALVRARCAAKAEPSPRQRFIAEHGQLTVGAALVLLLYLLVGPRVIKDTGFSTPVEYAIGMLLAGGLLVHALRHLRETSPALPATSTAVRHAQRIAALPDPRVAEAARAIEGFLHQGSPQDRAAYLATVSPALHAAGAPKTEVESLHAEVGDLQAAPRGAARETEAARRARIHARVLDRIRISQVT